MDSVLRDTKRTGVAPVTWPAFQPFKQVLAAAAPARAPEVALSSSVFNSGWRCVTRSRPERVRRVPRVRSPRRGPGVPVPHRARCPRPRTSACGRQRPGAGPLPSRLGELLLLLPSSCSSCLSWPCVSPRSLTRTGQRYVDRGVNVSLTGTGCRIRCDGGLQESRQADHRSARRPRRRRRTT